jgi:hypothetical protein
MTQCVFELACSLIWKPYNNSWVATILEGFMRRATGFCVVLLLLLLLMASSLRAQSLAADSLFDRPFKPRPRDVLIALMQSRDV